MDFGEEFSFDDESSGPRYSVLDGKVVMKEPLDRTVYTAVQGGRVRIRQGRLLVEDKNGIIVLNMPSAHVARLVLFGSVGLSAGARSWALGQEIDTIFCSRKGSYQGSLLSAGSPRRLDRLRAQLEVASDPGRAMPFARAVIEAKIRHQLTLVRHFATPDIADDIAPDLELLVSLRDLAKTALAPQDLMGVEGAAAKAYFSAVSRLMPEPLRFEGRSRRPPLNVFNSAIGYGYAILLGECVSALAAAGLDPGIGFLHVEEPNRPSLALDLMEEFRPLIVDQVVVHLCRRGSLTAEHGKTRASEPGVFLTKAGKAALIDGYEKRLLQVSSGSLPRFTGSLRRHIYRQAQRLTSYIYGYEDTWTGLSWR